jgi:hypothetical protein
MVGKELKLRTGLAERLTIGVIAIVAVAAAIIDTTGAFDHVPWLENHRLDFIILLVGLSAAFLSIHTTSIDNLRDTLENFSRLQQDSLDSSVRIIEGEDETYLESVSMLKQDCRVIFLMQRSATIILGPEAQLPHEREFYRVLMSTVASGTEFYQVISLEGIHSHLQRETRYFSSLDEAASHLVADASGRAQIKAGRIQVPLKQVRTDSGSIKPDKQARVLLVEHTDGTFEGLFAFDVGSLQSAIRISGPRVQSYLSRAIDFYRSDCTYVLFDHLKQIV